MFIAKIEVGRRNRRTGLIEYGAACSAPAPFEDARLAWNWLASMRRAQEDAYPFWGVGEYSDELRLLTYAATEQEYGNKHEDNPLNADGTGHVLATTPGIGDGPWDTTVDDDGMRYTVETS